MKQPSLKDTKKCFGHNLTDKQTQQHRFYNNYMPDISTIPFYHASGIYTICEEIAEETPISNSDKLEKNTVLEVY